MNKTETAILVIWMCLYDIIQYIVFTRCGHMPVFCKEFGSCIEYRIQVWNSRIPFINSWTNSGDIYVANGLPKSNFTIIELDRWTQHFWCLVTRFYWCFLEKQHWILQKNPLQDHMLQARRMCFDARWNWRSVFGCNSELCIFPQVGRTQSQDT